MLLPVCTLNFVLGNTSILFWKMYLDERACEFAMHRLCRSLSHCSFPFLLLWLLSFCVAMLEELGQNGNDIILFNYILLQIVGCSIIKNFAQFVGFVISPSELVMLLHSLPVTCEEASTSTTLCIVFPTGNSGTLTQESQFSWYLQVADTYFVWQFIAFQNWTCFEGNSAYMFWPIMGNQY